MVKLTKITENRGLLYKQEHFGIYVTLQFFSKVYQCPYISIYIYIYGNCVLKRHLQGLLSFIDVIEFYWHYLIASLKAH